LLIMTAASNDVQVLKWESDRNALLAAVRTIPRDDPRGDAMLDEAAELEARIATAPCDSRAVALVKLRTVVREIVCEGACYPISGEQIVAGLIAFLERSPP